MRPSTILAALAFVVWAVAGGLTIEQQADGIPLSLCVFAGLVAVTVTTLWAGHQVYAAMSRRVDEPLVIPPAWSDEFAAHAQDVAVRFVSRPVPVRPRLGDDGESTVKMETGSAVAVLDREPALPSPMDDPGYWLAYGHFAEDLLVSMDRDRNPEMDL